jgi:hypothetical protein
LFAAARLGTSFGCIPAIIPLNHAAVDDGSVSFSRSEDAPDFHPSDSGTIWCLLFLTLALDIDVGLITPGMVLPIALRAAISRNRQESL